MQPFMRMPARLLPALVLGLGLTLALGASRPGYAAQASLVVNASTGAILTADNADQPIRPASLTKMMTLYLTFEALGKGRLSWDEQIPISAHAAGTVPYKLGVAPGGTVSVREAVNGIIVISANDAAIALAERLGGTEDRFADMMTAKARQLSMTKTTFRTATGLTADGQFTTARDMAVLGLALMQHFPRQFPLFATRTTNFRGKPLTGHNYMLDLYPGVDGIKTGYTSASGYNVVTSVMAGGRRYIGVVLGYPTDKARDQQMVNLFRQYLQNPAAAQAASSPTIGGAVGLY
ncbi:D-alanyl-D-alanine carboxypeptidase family protein [Rhizobium straminoryzae]|uniref:D-alanyl-D-alanine carboxypeptidase n=1 Tax=Rhizobium straminoryzae TaxID=1387186 RepID=A0A549SMS8_9HYPH|nr:D-alanyl-D-alanine carboxypeptidase family protein [Rhizobium straminoryzae]TRL30925.1 D-alanyl-D-alanine carboxypeptidase [Rhizobium straminoryzae]